MKNLQRFELFDWKVPSNSNALKEQLSGVLSQKPIRHFTLGHYTTSLNPNQAHAFISDILESLSSAHLRHLYLLHLDYSWSELEKVFRKKPELLRNLTGLEVKIGRKVGGDNNFVQHDMPLSFLTFLREHAPQLQFLHFSWKPAPVENPVPVAEPIRIDAQNGIAEVVQEEAAAVAQEEAYQWLIAYQFQMRYLQLGLVPVA